MEFPKDFYFGASTASHQVEGNTSNDWTEWEKKNVDRLVRSAMKRAHTSNHQQHTATHGWPDYITKRYPNPLIPSNYISGLATDHYHRFEEDFALAKKLGHNAHRFSIEWARIEPFSGIWNEKEIEHYRAVIASLKKHKIEPFVTLWHWTLPRWLAAEGGVRAKRFPEYFARYAEKMVRTLGEDVQFWITLNEPEIYSLNSYFRAIWPPEEGGLLAYHGAISKLIRAHRAGYTAIKKINPEAQVGVACNLAYFESGGGIVNNILARIAENAWNHYFLRRTQNSLDWIGLNYYFHNRIYYGFNKNKNEKVSDLGWELYPQGIKFVLQSLTRYKKSIYVTENGLADSEDASRAWFIEETMRALLEAREAGVDLRGYLHWSLLDNFEWDKGFWPRFGLIEIDYATLARKPRESALAYKKIIEGKK
jgi:beta-glucosidase